MPDITSVTVTFGHGIKREEYGPVKKAEVTITASVGEGEMGESVLALVSAMAISKVAEMLDAPKPDLTANRSQEEAQPAAGEPPARKPRGKKAEAPKEEAPKEEESIAGTEQPSESGEPSTEGQPAEAEDEWSVGADDVTITDQELLAATSKRAQELGARQPIVDLIATFATRTEGPPFKVQEIPQNQRKDYLTKLAALTA